MIVRARVPTRIDFLGGGSDAPPFSAEHGGAVVNGAISRYAVCTLETGGHLEGIEIESVDFGRTVRAESVEALRFDGTLDLLKAVIRRSGLAGPFRMRTEVDLPLESGLGASGAVTISVLAACRAALGRPIDPSELTEQSFAAERLDLGLPGGKQDQCGAAWGGIRCYEFKDPEVTVHDAELPPELVAELEHRLLLSYTGVSHLSNNIHADIRAAYGDDASPCKRAMFGLARIAREGLTLLRQGRLEPFARLLDENWR